MQSPQSHDINTALRGTLFGMYSGCVGFTTIQHNSIKQIARKEPYITEDVFLSLFSRPPTENGLPLTRKIHHIYAHETISSSISKEFLKYPN
jgi:hypothetical protein